MLPARTIADVMPPRPTDGLALMTRDECAAWQVAAERIARRHDQPGRTLEIAIAALTYTLGGVAPDDGLRLAEVIIFR